MEKSYGNNTFEDFAKNPELLPSGVYVENEDLVFTIEKERINTLDDTTANYNYSSDVVLNTSSAFKVYKSKINTNDEFYNIRFISINNQLPNSELRESITQGIWYGDNNFVFAVSGKGIYMYDAQTRSYKTLVTGKQEYKILKIINNTLYYNNVSIELQ